MADHLPHPQPAEAVPGPNCARKPCKEHNNPFKIRQIGYPLDSADHNL